MAKNIKRRDGLDFRLEHKMKKILGPTLALLIIGVLVFTGCGGTDSNQTHQEEEKSQEATSAETVASESAPVVTPTVSIATRTKAGSYINDKFGYTLTPPAGYQLTAESSAGQPEGRPYDQDKVVISDDTGKVFATIYTPVLEVGYEGWSTVERKELTVPESGTKLQWWQGRPNEAGSSDWVVLVTWNTDGNNFSQSGSIDFRYTPDQAKRLRDFTTMINSLRFQ